MPVAASHPSSHHKRKCLQVFPSAPWGEEKQKSPVSENHCPNAVVTLTAGSHTGHLCVTLHPSTGPRSRQTHRCLLDKLVPDKTRRNTSLENRMHPATHSIISSFVARKQNSWKPGWGEYHLLRALCMPCTALSDLHVCAVSFYFARELYDSLGN